MKGVSRAPLTSVMPCATDSFDWASWILHHFQIVSDCKSAVLHNIDWASWTLIRSSLKASDEVSLSGSPIQRYACWCTVRLPMCLWSCLCVEVMQLTQEVLRTQRRPTRACVTHRVFENKMAALRSQRCVRKKKQTTTTTKIAQSIPLLVYSLVMPGPVKWLDILSYLALSCFDVKNLIPLRECM